MGALDLSGLMLPSTHLRQQTAQIVKDNVRQFLIDGLADPPGHAYAVASGREHFRQMFLRGMGCFFSGNLAQADQLAEVCYGFLQERWHALYPHISPQQFLDTYQPPPGPPTAEEIDEAWELEIAGDERALRRHYEGSARVRKGKDLGSRRTPLSDDEV